jgi:hypothetical protein
MSIILKKYFLRKDTLYISPISQLFICYSSLTDLMQRICIHPVICIEISNSKPTKSLKNEIWYEVTFKNQTHSHWDVCFRDRIYTLCPHETKYLTNIFKTKNDFTCWVKITELNMFHEWVLNIIYYLRLLF